MPTSKTYPIALPLLLLCLVASLVNIGLFGQLTLAAYFGFTIVSTLFAFIILLQNLSSKANFAFPLHIYIFCLLALYIWFNGIFTNGTNLMHYYWAIAAIFLLATSQLQKMSLNSDVKKYPPPLNFSNNLTNVAYKGIALLMLVQSLVVLAQLLKLVPSANPLFACTGSWVNPNVTAMFLAMGWYAFLQVLPKKIVAHFLFLFVLAAIVALKCRTAYVVSLLLIAGHFWRPIQIFAVQKLKLGKNATGFVFAIATISVLAIAAFYFKQASTNGRLHILKNSIALIAQKPLIGHGFGLFEKHYNTFIATHPSPENDHVNMPYNDFLELAVEGGLVAVAFWIAFIIALLRYNLQNKKSVWPVMAFLAMQLTNFGFQAIPAFALFLLYAGMATSPVFAESSNKQLPPPPVGIWNFPFWNILAALVAISLFFKEVHLAKAFYKNNEITDNYPPPAAIEGYASLGNQLNGYQRYHEAYGDAYLQMQQYAPALVQYLAAAKSCSFPSVLSKTGYCYQQLHKYDSSQYYYQLVQNMQPYAYVPRMALLKLYEQEKDTPQILQKAQEIIGMPTKIKSERVDEIKAYAKKILATMGHTKAIGFEKPP
jgi:hypothetical protein